MPREGKALLVLASVVVFVVLEFAALALLNSSSTLQNIWFNRASNRVLAFLWSGNEKAKNYVNTLALNDALAAQNATLQEQLRLYGLRLEQLEEEGHLITTPHQSFRYTPATVVRMSSSSAHNYIILNKGSLDGIHPQSGIITEQGVVGIVRAVSNHYCYGLTLMNPNINISARIGTADVTTLLSWDGIRSNGGVIRDIPPHYVIERGDTVRTSGYSNIFPPMVPIGVARESHLVDGLARQVDVTLFQDFRNIRYVTIVENLDRAELDALEATDVKKNKK